MGANVKLVALLTGVVCTAVTIVVMSVLTGSTDKPVDVPVEPDDQPTGGLKYEPPAEPDEIPINAVE